ncbi:chromate efflux transporter [Pelagicoccus sp. SDUM812002]|uniref:chromate efflux transporter n=1 Tax=Pelagicoccus sp. SDUM812002 TaxID=3041266 RepID=UPI0028106C46|nr:chromate efflux transporter [Pelagicoccus sp. SDUM812002]MDQ8187130.1 chromate efflux transporter [Pelagicoccus sp. SDUM812002]
MREIFLTFLRLGCYAFGGPTAHMGYFHEEFVKRRKWLSEADFADTVALCQFLPGPSSSQAGFAIGLDRGGILGAFLAWIGFTLPSAVLMIAFALGLEYAGDLSQAGWVAGLKLVAVAVVANAAWSMAKSLCPDRLRATIAALETLGLLLTSDPLAQLVGILLGGAAGFLLYRGQDHTSAVRPTSQSGSQIAGSVYLALFFLLLAGLPIAAQLLPENETIETGDAFYRAGSLVFGGGHVVLPLLDSYTVQCGWIDESSFLAGYGAAQALPGPLFAFSSFLGTGIDHGPRGVSGGVYALVMIYLPAWLLVLGAIPFWDRLRKINAARAALLGANAAVVGLLFAALYDPIWQSSITSNLSFGFALTAFFLLKFWKIPPWLIAALGAGLGQILL